MLISTRDFLLKSLIILVLFNSIALFSEWALAEGIFVKEPKRKTLFLSLKEGVGMVLAKNLDITLKKIAPQIVETRIGIERGTFDPELSASINRKDSTTPLNTRSSVAAGGRTSTKSETINLDSKITGKIPLGTEYDIGFDSTETKSTFNNFESEYDSFAGIVITQPLLKDYGTDTNLFQIRIARKDRDIALYELKSLIMEMVAEFQMAYWDLVLAIEDLKVKEESFRLAEFLLDRNRKRLIAGVISPLEVTQAEAGMASRREGVIVGKRVVEEKKNVLKRLISPDVSTMRNVDVVPADRPPIRVVETDVDKSVEWALGNRPEYLRLKVEVEKRNVKIKYARNQVFPRIDLEASYGFNGLGGSFGESVDDLRKNREWLLGLAIKYPLGNRKTKGDLSIAKLEAREALLDLKNIEQDIIIDIENVVREVRTDIERIEATKVSTRLAEEALRAEELKLNAGISTSHNVLEFQEKLSQARSNEIKALIDHNKSLVKLLKLEGMILEKNDIIFSDES